MIYYFSTPSELNLNCVSTLSELATLNYIIFSSFSVLIDYYIKNRKKGTKRELTI